MQTGGGHQLCHIGLATALICTGWRKGPYKLILGGLEIRMTEAV